MPLSRKEFCRKPLRAHALLAGLPLRTLLHVDLPGGHPGMLLPEISAIVGFGGGQEVEVGPVTRALFWLRGLIGRALGWEDADDLVRKWSFVERLTDEDRARTLVSPGTADGIMRILYSFENEFLGEIVNRTVHCFVVMTSEETAEGYGLTVAIYVRRLNWFTPIYMALTAPVLEWVVYPSMTRGIRRSWARAFPPRPRPGLGIPTYGAPVSRAR
jgi:hypothetical protein